MQRSVAKILATHVGSLPFLSLDRGVAIGDQTHLADDVAAIVARQRQIGIDIVNEGEYSKGGDWLRYMQNRFGGFTEIAAADEKPLIERGKDREEFADFYKYATERGTLFYAPGAQIAKKRPVQACTGPVTYVGQAELKKEIDVAVAVAGTANVFLTSTAPGSLEVYRRNRYYKNDEDYVFALAEAMRVEYEAIAAAGLILQIDDAWLPALWDRIGMEMGLAAFRARCEMRIEALNHALRNIPEDRVRYHLCWGSWHGPHAFDLELERIVDIVLKVKAQAFLIEGANARHEHEVAVWDQVKLPAGKILIPGVVTHSTDVVEHPELVSQRLQRYARRVGKDGEQSARFSGRLKRNGFRLNRPFRFSLLFEHDLFRKPVSTFRDHALIAGLAEKARIRLNRTNKENRAVLQPHGDRRGETPWQRRRLTSSN